MMGRPRKTPDDGTDSGGGGDGIHNVKTPGMVVIVVMMVVMVVMVETIDGIFIF